jgi:hypothetical protein
LLFVLLLNEPLLLLLDQLIYFANKFHQPVWVSLRGGFSAEPPPTFFSFAFHRVISGAF